MDDPATAGGSPAAGDAGEGERGVDGGVNMSRKEKRKAMKKLKRKQLRKETAIREKDEEEARANDPEEKIRERMREEGEREVAERERKAFEEKERLWLEAAAARKKKQEEEQEELERKRKLLEESEESKKDKENLENLEEDDDEWEYIEEGPAEIIWKGNEIIVKKKKVRVPKRNTPKQQIEQDEERPTSNPLAPQSVAFASAQEILERVAQQTPNFGTEQDKAHCPFHLKTGACRFGLRCSRLHFYPEKSCTLLMKNMYNGPGLSWDQDEGLEYTDEEVECSYEEFYEDVHTEFLKFGELINFKVCRNGAHHLRGNVYVHYKSLDSAILAYNTINGRYFAGKQIICEFVGVTRWKAAICGEYMKSRFKTCSHGSACNFIHCFRNPGGDYEWADWDHPPPNYWIKKMISLFGFSDQSYYENNKLTESNDFERSKSSDRRPTPARDRHQSRSSARDELDLKRDHSRRQRESSFEKYKYHRTGDRSKEREKESSVHNRKHWKYEERENSDDHAREREKKSRSKSKDKSHEFEKEGEIDRPSIDEERYNGRIHTEDLGLERETSESHEKDQYSEKLNGRRAKSKKKRERESSDSYADSTHRGKIYTEYLSLERETFESHEHQYSEKLDGRREKKSKRRRERGSRDSYDDPTHSKSISKRTDKREKRKYSEIEQKDFGTSDTDSCKSETRSYKRYSKMGEKDRYSDKSKRKRSHTHTHRERERERSSE